MEKLTVRISVRNLVEFILREEILTAAGAQQTKKPCRREAVSTEKYRKAGRHIQGGGFAEMEK